MEESDVEQINHALTTAKRIIPRRWKNTVVLQGIYWNSQTCGLALLEDTILSTNQKMSLYLSLWRKFLVKAETLVSPFNDLQSGKLGMQL